MRGAVVNDAGEHGESFEAVRRVAHFATRFGRVLSSFDPAFHPISLLPLDAGKASAAAASKRKPAGKVGEAAASGVSIVHATGSQGGVAFLFDDPANVGKPFQTHTLLLADGTTLAVPLTGGGQAWCLLGVNVTPRCRVDYANLSTLGAVGQSLTLFGPARASGIVSVNGSPIALAWSASQNANPASRREALRQTSKPAASKTAHHSTGAVTTVDAAIYATRRGASATPVVASARGSASSTSSTSDSASSSP
jgi:hypothetical protein